MRFIHGRCDNWRRHRAKRRLLREMPEKADEIPTEQWLQSLADPTAFYFRCFHYFHTRLPEPLREHRDYFSRNRRGLGEDAFHTMWHLLFREFQPAEFLEIGVYRGQTISLAALLARLNNKPCEVFGISPFSPVGDSVSRYRQNVDYYQDTQINFDHFKLPHPNRLRAHSTDETALELIRSRPWAMIYIDGNHDYDVVVEDWEACSRNLKSGGVIVLDDAALETSFQPPLFASKGHPGPSRMAQEIDRKQFREILQVGHNRVFQKIAA